MRAGSGIVRERGCLKGQSENYCCVFGISPYGSCIESLGGDNIHAGPGEIGFLSQALRQELPLP